MRLKPFHVVLLATDDINKDEDTGVKEVNIKKGRTILLDIDRFTDAEDLEDVTVIRESHIPSQRLSVKYRLRIINATTGYSNIQWKVAETLDEIQQICE